MPACGSNSEVCKVLLRTLHITSATSSKDHNCPRYGERCTSNGGRSLVLRFRPTSSS
ncbi:hypothetical protein FRC03_011895 [Tulasnella sp. 419]|nr:hypothetical protein FRC03_011895 [Tulasnella sp. 419]